ncbi:MAG: hypothetical protein R3E66_10575 [bacterium]
MMLLGIMIIVPALLIFGPIVEAKFAFVVEALGGPAANSIQAREARAPGSDKWLYVVLFTAISAVFSIVFVFPLLFKRARVRRQVIINDLAERFPFLEPLADRSHEFEANMRELKMLADEVRDIEPPRATSLQVAAPDLGRSASPADVTMTNDMMIVRDDSPEETIPGTLVAPNIRATPMAGMPSIQGTPMHGTAAVRSTPMYGAPAVPTAPDPQAVQDAWAPKPAEFPAPAAAAHQPHPSPQPQPQKPSPGPRTFNVPDLGSLAFDEDNIATVDVRDPSLLTSLPMSEFRDRIKPAAPADPDETIMPSGLELEGTLPKPRRPTPRMSDEITMDWGHDPTDE